MTNIFLKRKRCRTMAEYDDIILNGRNDVHTKLC